MLYCFFKAVVTRIALQIILMQAFTLSAIFRPAWYPYLRSPLVQMFVHSPLGEIPGELFIADQLPVTHHHDEELTASAVESRHEELRRQFIPHAFSPRTVCDVCVELLRRGARVRSSVGDMPRKGRQQMLHRA